MNMKEYTQNESNDEGKKKVQEKQRDTINKTYYPKSVQQHQALGREKILLKNQPMVV